MQSSVNIEIELLHGWLNLGSSEQLDSPQSNRNYDCLPPHKISFKVTVRSSISSKFKMGQGLIKWGVVKDE